MYQYLFHINLYIFLLIFNIRVLWYIMVYYKIRQILRGQKYSEVRIERDEISVLKILGNLRVYFIPW